MVDRYYNPGNYFTHVHFMLLSDRQEDIETIQPAVQKMTGDAIVGFFFYKLKDNFFRNTLGWRRLLIQRWVDRMVGVVGIINPDLIRCYGVHLNAYIAYCAKKALGIPYVVSVHINPDSGIRGTARDWKDYLVKHTTVWMERLALGFADAVLPVYESILPYVKRMKASNVEIVHNVINTKELCVKEDYRLGKPVTLLSVSRQIPEKNPENIIRAIAGIRDVYLTMVGYGEYHAYLKDLAWDLNVSSRIDFIHSLGNDELCHGLWRFDLFVVHSDIWEVSKSVLEALLAGLPVIINRRKGEPVPEWRDDFIHLVDNTPDSYKRAIMDLLKDHQERKRLGQAGYAFSAKNWGPGKAEAKIEKIYQRIRAGKGSKRSPLSALSGSILEEYAPNTEQQR